MGHHSATREAARSSRDFRTSSSVEDALFQNRNTPFLGGTPLLDDIPSFIKCLQSQHVSFRSHLTSSPEHRLGVLYHRVFGPLISLEDRSGRNRGTRAAVKPTATFREGLQRRLVSSGLTASLGGQKHARGLTEDPLKICGQIFQNPKTSFKTCYLRSQV